jgi:myo-inositol 2-dehydrogenase/D-chiro-inositol 1-dehydrogenase
MSVRLGFIGTGGIANHHMRTLIQIETAEMVAFCDVDAEKAKATAASYGGTAYTSYVEMFDQEKLDAVYLCVPPFAHGAPEAEAIRRGLPLFIEKPVATNLSQAETTLAAIQAAGLISAVGYHWRYMDTTARAKACMGTQPVGFALGSWTGGMPTVSWWRVMAESGGQIVEQTTHIFDLARYLLGEVKQVQAIGRSGLMEDVDNYDIHDATVTNLEFTNGAIASITTACMLNTGGEVGLDLYLKDQVLRMTLGTLTVEKTTGKEIINLGNNPTLAEDRAFIDAVQSQDPGAIRCTYADAMQTLKLTLAATQSAVENRPIEL